MLHDIKLGHRLHVRIGLIAISAETKQNAEANSWGQRWPAQTLSESLVPRGSNWTILLGGEGGKKGLRLFFGD